MRLTDALRGEHAVLYELFNCVRVTIEASDDLAVIQNSVLFLDRNLRAHATIEDELLFPQLDPHIGGAGPLEMMRAEHQGIDDLLTAIRDENEVPAIKSLITQLLDLAHGHFQKEEMALFGIAEQFLSQDELTALGEQWSAKRNVDIEGHSCMSAA